MSKNGISFFGDGAEFSHFGIAVESIDSSLGLNKIADPVQKVFVAFTEIHGIPVELVEPMNKSSPVSDILKKGGGGYHLCYRVPNLDFACEEARRNGLLLFSAPVEAVAFSNKKIAWLFHPVYGIFELLEK
jgi:hypothetical protein